MSSLTDRDGRFDAGAAWTPTAELDETRYRAFFEQAVAGLCSSTAEGKFLDANPALARMLGYDSVDQLLLERPSTLDMWCDAGHRKELLARLARDGEARGFEAELRTRDGGSVWVSLDARAVRGEGGVLVGLESMVVDIAERKREERRLATLAAMVESSGDAIVCTASDGTITSWNKAAELLYGYRAEEVLGRSLTMLIPEDRLEESRTIRARAAKGGHLPAFETVRVRKDGTRIDVSATVSPLVDANGTIIGTSSTSRDVTWQKEVARATDARALHEAAVAALGTLALGSTDMQGLLDASVEMVAKTLEVDFASVLQLTPARDRLHLSAGTGWREGLVGATDIPVSFDSMAGAALAADAPLASEDVSAETRFAVHPLLAEHGITSALAVVMRGVGGPLGVLMAFTTGTRRFSEDEIGFLQSVADVLALALQRHEAEATLEETVRALRETDEERRRLLSQLVRAEEEERRRIAGDIHDDSIQVMTALGMRLHSLARHLPGEQAGAVTELEDIVGMTIDRLRHLMFQLRPSALDRQGLTAAVQEYLELLRAEVRLQYRLDSKLSAEPSPEGRVILYRIAHEALNNVRRHAQAQNIRVTLEERGAGVFVQIEDDGRGFAADEVLSSPPKHLGLTSMRERAEMAGGYCTVRSLPGDGTHVEFWIPSHMESRADGQRGR